MTPIHVGWFPPDIEPVRPGAYQRDYGDADGPSVIQFCWWDGSRWFAQCETAEHAKAEQCPSMVPAPWRGLTLEEFTQRHKDASRVLDRLILDSKP